MLLPFFKGVEGKAMPADSLPPQADRHKRWPPDSSKQLTESSLT